MLGITLLMKVRKWNPIEEKELPWHTKVSATPPHPLLGVQQKYQVKDTEL